MADEVALNLLVGHGEDKYKALMVTRLNKPPSGNWYALEECLRKAIKNSQDMRRLDYYEGRPYIPIAGACLIRWDEE